MDERELGRRLYGFIKEGAHARVNGTSCCPYDAGTVKSMLHSVGWVQEDLRQDLIKAKLGWPQSPHK